MMKTDQQLQNKNRKVRIHKYEKVKLTTLKSTNLYLTQKQKGKYDCN